MKGDIIMEDARQVKIKVGNQNYVLAREKIAKIVKSSAEANLLDNLRRLRKQGELFKAYDQYTQYLNDHPDAAEARTEREALVPEIEASLNRKFGADMRRKDYTAALEGLNGMCSQDRPLPPSTILLHGHLAEVHYLRAREYYAEFAFEKARDDLVRALGYNKDHLPACDLLAGIYLDKMKIPQDAAPLLEKVCSAPGATTEQKLRRIRCWIPLRRFDDAERLYLELLQLAKNEQETATIVEPMRPVMLDLARQLAQENDRRRAITWIERWFKSYPEPPELVQEEYQRFYSIGGMRQTLNEMTILQELPALLERLAALKANQLKERETAERAIRALFARLESMQPEQCAQHLLNVLPGKPAPARASLLRLLGWFGGPRALAAVQAGLKDPDADVFNAAIQALAAWPDAKPLEELAGLAKDAPKKNQRLTALQGFVRLTGLPSRRPPEQTLHLYETALQAAHDADGKRLVFATIAQQPNLAALDFVNKHLKDPEAKAEAKKAHDAIARLLADTVVVENGAVLDSKDAQLHGEGIAYEKRPERLCLGNWNNPRAWASWEITIAQPGAFTIEVAQSMLGNPGSEYVVAVGNQWVTGTVQDSKSWARFISVPLGEVNIAAPGRYTVAVSPTEKASAPVMNLRHVVLKRKGAKFDPAAAVAAAKPPATPDASGKFTLDGVTATLHPADKDEIRYQDEANRRCIGYWNSTKSWVSWRIKVDRPGNYQVRVSQARKDNADTGYEVRVGGQKVAGQVKGTGDWAKFITVDVGRLEINKAGVHQLSFKITGKKGAGGGVMNLRAVILEPVK